MKSTQKPKPKPVPNAETGQTLTELIEEQYPFSWYPHWITLAIRGAYRTAYATALQEGFEQGLAIDLEEESE